MVELTVIWRAIDETYVLLAVIGSGLTLTAGIGGR
jgi:hypothetical protein